jgi:hypothetical protein
VVDVVEVGRTEVSGLAIPRFKAWMNGKRLTQATKGRWEVISNGRVFECERERTRQGARAPRRPPPTELTAHFTGHRTSAGERLSRARVTDAFSPRA